MSRFYNQSRSQLERKGKTQYEDEITKCLEFWNVIPLRGYCICFECGKQWPLIDENSFPQICRNPSCRKKYNDRGMFCLPDHIIEQETATGIKRAIVFVNGEVHEKPKVKAGDKYKMLRLMNLGYRIFVIKNEAIGNLYDMNLLALMKVWIEMLRDNILYEKLKGQETEIPFPK